MASRKPASRERAPSGATTARAFGVVLERIESQMAVVLEAVTGSAERLDAKIDGVEARLSERISRLEDVVRQNSTDIGALRTDVNALRVEVARLRHDFDHREERGRIDALEARVAVLEGRLGVA
jgi:polyhydroxyalkanoate synthesis regulator phasin